MIPSNRHALLIDILRKGSVSSQVEIAQTLAQAGVIVTQTTVSRDLAAIGAMRSKDGYLLPETRTDSDVQATSSGKDELWALIHHHVISVAQAQSLVVVKTAPGHAQMMASAFDRWPPDGVVGTVAGDDTIFLATTSNETSEQLGEALDQAMRGQQA